MAPPSEDATAPSEPHRHTPSPQARRARIGTLLMFTVNGMTFASLIPRYPQIKADLDASRTTWGLAVGLGPLGGLILGLFAARLIRRHGSRTIALWPQILSTACLLLLAHAPHIAWVFVAMIVMNAFDALTDIAMNYQGLLVQQLYHRSIVNTFHGWWSIGAVAGGLVGSTAAQQDIDLNLQVSLTLIALTLMSLLAWSFMLPDTQPDPALHNRDEHAGGLAHDPSSTSEPPPAEGVRIIPGTQNSSGRKDRPTPPEQPASPGRLRRRTPLARLGRHIGSRHGRTLGRRGLWARVIILGVVGSLAGGIEIGGSSWAPLYLDSAFRTRPFVAGLGFVCLMSAETIGRLVGDAIANRIGAGATVAQGAVVCVIGTLLMVLWPTVATALIGFTAAGWGVSTTIPLAMDNANSTPGLAAGSGLTVATWIMRLGFMIYPVLIGLLGDTVSLRWALICLPAGALLILMATPAFQPVTAAPPRTDTSTEAG